MNFLYSFCFPKDHKLSSDLDLMHSPINAKNSPFCCSMRSVYSGEGGGGGGGGGGELKRETDWVEGKVGH